MSKNDYEFDWRGLKNDLKKTAKVPVWGIVLLAIGVVGLVAYANIDGNDEGYNTGYNQAMLDDHEQNLYMLWLDHDFNTRQESFWSIIMWETATHTTQIFFSIIIVLVLLAVRW